MLVRPVNQRKRGINFPHAERPERATFIRVEVTELLPLDRIPRTILIPRNREVVVELSTWTSFRHTPIWRVNAAQSLANWARFTSLSTTNSCLRTCSGF